jgi:mono/diheme cytochrome c family protein
MTRSSKAVFGWLVVAATACFGVDVARPSATGAAQTDRTAAENARAALRTYCVTCHNERLKTAGLMLDSLDVEQAPARPAVWEKVAHKLRAHEMPPPTAPRPDEATYAALAAFIETSLDRAAARHPDPGRVPVHRLNRAEYVNAVRDLLGLEVDARTLLPADDADRQGFDNIAGVLSVSPALIERYMAAARKISRLAVGDPALVPVFETYKTPKMLAQDERMDEDLPFGSRGGVAVRHWFPVDAEYVIKVRLRRQLYDYILGMGEPHQLEVRLDGKRLQRFSIGGEATGRPAPATFVGNMLGSQEWEKYMHEADSGLELRVTAPAGRHIVGVSFIDAPIELEGVLQPPQTGFDRGTNEQYDGNPAIDSVAIGGPYKASGPGASISRRRLFVCEPASKASEDGCARKILSTLARRAYRRPVADDDLRTLWPFFEAGRKTAGFDRGIQQALERLLADPDFLFRIERAPEDVKPGTPYRLTDTEIASRLSFFLWSSLPDDELLDAAVRGQLSDPAVLERQVKRMLADPRSNALVGNFAGQWLGLRKIAGMTPDPDTFPEFDENLRSALVQETELFLDSQLRDDRSIVDLVSADYTFVNERLARHYGIPNVYGSRFRRVTMSGERRGLLGQASILALTSYPNRTSPVLRGKWLLDNVLGSPPPPPPPNVPDLRTTGEDGRPASIRDRMEQHRTNAVCASCHVRMDPLGFALENFDALGKWRTTSDGVRVDASGVLPDGSRFDGLAGLQTFLADHRGQVVSTVTEKLLTYAVGRSVEYYDQPTIRAVVNAAAPKDYRWSAIILGIVRSTPFQMRRAAS